MKPFALYFISFSFHPRNLHSAINLEFSVQSNKGFDASALLQNLALAVF